MDNNKINYSDFYYLIDPLVSKFIRLGIQKPVPQFKLIIGAFRNEINFEQPLILVQESGRLVVDILWSSYPPVFVVSQTILDILIDNKLFGWNTYPVKVFDKELQTLNNYFGFAVTGRVGNQDFNRGQIEIIPPTRKGGKPHKAFKGLYFIDDEWDGNDFCVTGFGGGPVVTKNVVNIFKESNVKNVAFIPLPEYETSYDALTITGNLPTIEQ